jgi:hypothetical protein
MLIKMSGIRYENLQGNIKGNWYKSLSAELELQTMSKDIGEILGRLKEKNVIDFEKEKIGIKEK